MALDFIYPTPLPSTKGWGPGWPNCQPAAREGVSIFFPGVHRHIAPLVTMLVDEMRDRGFQFLVPGCWGFGCRGTKSSSGGTSGTPSFHSWGLGFDINAPLNVFGSESSRAQLAQPKFAWVIELWREYGFFWLGPDIRDWMHMSFVGSPEDAQRMTAKAREEFMGTADIRAGGAARRRGDPIPPDASADFRYGWHNDDRIIRARQLPKPGDPGPHTHGHGDIPHRHTEGQTGLPVAP